VAVLAPLVCPANAAIRLPEVAALPLPSAAESRLAVLVAVLALLARLSSVDKVLAPLLLAVEPVPSSEDSDEPVLLS